MLPQGGDDFLNGDLTVGVRVESGDMHRRGDTNTPVRSRVCHILRRETGFLWRMDSYDELKPRSIATDGCTGGFSRYAVWMDAYRTNNDPKWTPLSSALQGSAPAAGRS